MKRYTVLVTHIIRSSNNLQDFEDRKCKIVEVKSLMDINDQFDDIVDVKILETINFV